MARRGRNDGQPKLPLERQVGKALTDEEITAKSRELCGVYSAIDGLQDKVRADTKASKDEIRVLQIRTRNLRQEILDGIEMRKQGDLFAKEEAQHALHDVAAAAGEVKPSDPHQFEWSKGKPFECSLCGSSPTDPVHDLEAAAVAAEPDGNGGAELSTVLDEDPAATEGSSWDARKAMKARKVKRGKGPLARAGRRRGKEARA
jgi:hypothetical protein